MAPSVSPRINPISTDFTPKSLKPSIPRLSSQLVTKTIVLNEGDPTTKREEIRRYFHDTFTLYESLFECLASDKSYYTRANSTRHPLIFYYGHTAVFYINKLNVMHLINRRINPRLEALLAVGVNEMSWDDLEETNYDWPSPAEVHAYRAETRKIVDEFITNADCSLPIKWDHPMWIIMMGIEHERIHLETSSVLIRELPLSLVRDHPIWGAVCTKDNLVVENELLSVDGGVKIVGRGSDSTLYGWDNEYGTQKHVIAPFEASRYLASNAEYKRFVDADGYKNERYWTEEGWKWVTKRSQEMPVYWVRQGKGLHLRTMLKNVPLPLSWPVEVNQLEAKAFCNWKAEQTGLNVRLPSEAEWYLLRDTVPTDQPYWAEAPGNINLEGSMSPVPVDTHAFDTGFYDIIGNVWQWTETPMDSLDGYQVHPAYDDFSTPEFHGLSNVFKGGCWISTGNYAIKMSRYQFRRHFHQHSGFRYVVGPDLPKPSTAHYETDSVLSTYIEFHYGPAHLGVQNFPKRCVQEALKHVHPGMTGKALDLGCASGRSSYELARVFDHVDALDFSVRFIQAAVQLQRGNKQRYAVQDEGELQTEREVQLKDFDGYVEAKDKILFAQGDACNLLEKYDGYDLVFGGNLIDRLYEPAKFLELIKGRINTGGILVLASPYTWLEEFTTRENWIGGFKDASGENYTTLHAMTALLAPEFSLECAPIDVPFVIRETRRKFQHSFSELTVWRKRA